MEERNNLQTRREDLRAVGTFIDFVNDLPTSAEITLEARPYSEALQFGLDTMEHLLSRRYPGIIQQDVEISRQLLMDEALREVVDDKRGVLVTLSSPEGFENTLDSLLDKIDNKAETLNGKRKITSNVFIPYDNQGLYSGIFIYEFPA